VASSTIALVERPVAVSITAKRTARFDRWFVLGLVIAIGSVILGISITGISPWYFLQPAAASIVIGGTLGVTLITTPRSALLHSARRALIFGRPNELDRPAVIEELMNCARVRRKSGLLSLKNLAEQAAHPAVREILTLLLDVQDRGELQTALETKMRVRERHDDADARVFETMGGFAPTIGVLGTVVGLIDVLRQFSQPALIAHGIGTAFVSTIYGLALANLILLPAAGRIRAAAAEAIETSELMAEGALGLLDGVHVAILRDRLNSYVRAER